MENHVPPADRPTRLEHEYKRAGALHLFAAFDTRTGKVYARTALRKRQKEFIALLVRLDRELPSAIRRIWLVLDNLSVHKGKQVQTWLQDHPRFMCFFLPVHCSWMNQVEQWFSLLREPLSAAGETTVTSIDAGATFSLAAVS